MTVKRAIRNDPATYKPSHLNPAGHQPVGNTQML